MYINLDNADSVISDLILSYCGDIDPDIYDEVYDRIISALNYGNSGKYNKLNDNVLSAIEGGTV